MILENSIFGIRSVLALGGGSVGLITALRIRLLLPGRKPDLGRAWDEIRDFPAFHYKFNTRLDTPFWTHCREHTSLGDFEGVYQAYRRFGPSPEVVRALPHRPNVYGIEGYLAMLVGMRVPHEKPHIPTAAERETWERHLRAMRVKMAAAVSSEQLLAAIRSPHWQWT